MADLHPVQARLIVAMQAEYERARAMITPDLEKRGIEPDLIQLTIAQNAIRTALEATFEAMLPYSEATAVNLGMALASYCVSALPEENQRGAIDALVEQLPKTHQWRISRGTRLSTTWITNGVERPNFADDAPLGRQG